MNTKLSNTRPTLGSSAAAASVRIGISAVVLALSAAVTAAQGEPAATVRMTQDMTFEPAAVTVQAGSTVLWENTSGMPHTVTADPAQARNPQHVELPEGAEPFDSGLIQPGETYSQTFTVPGRYTYFCIPHESAGMVGTVVVE